MHGKIMSMTKETMKANILWQTLNDRELEICDKEMKALEGETMLVTTQLEIVTKIKEVVAPYKSLKEILILAMTIATITDRTINKPAVESVEEATKKLNNMDKLLSTLDKMGGFFLHGRCMVANLRKTYESPLLWNRQ